LLEVVGSGDEEMSSSTIAIIGIAGLLMFMLLRMPVSFAMALAGFLGLSYMISVEAAFHILATDVWGMFISYGLSVIPLFILMGQIIFHSGVGARIFETAHRWFGELPGGVAMTTIAASAGFAAICGSNAATAATMGTVALPEMKKYGYDRALSAGVVATGGTLGVLIPPSIVLIIIGLQTGQSITKLFVGSILTGLLLAILFMVTNFVLCWHNPALGPRSAKISFREKLASLTGVTETLTLFVLVIGGLYAGWFTPTEAGAAGTFGAIIITLVRRRLTWQVFTQSIVETLKISCMVMVLVTGAVTFGRFLTVTRLPFALADGAAALPLPPAAILAIVLLVLIIGGCFMDALGFLIIAIPIFFPLAMALGYDPIWIGVIFTVATTMGAITPPVGVCVYVVSGLAIDIPIEAIFKSASFFFMSFVICVILLFVFPQIVLFLPGLAR
jgi:tripartite ATP-independent transporter DctM subunit